MDAKIGRARIMNGRQENIQRLDMENDGGKKWKQKDHGQFLAPRGPPDSQNRNHHLHANQSTPAHSVTAAWSKLFAIC
ncbi:hypothetical protein U9M48_025550 [Paspalum notatum var. saurae]|uniref:Uncharacterized protein n=1 Tax=Paspalum notatum var. saurae TaxID=547442 RepID=A0AAQ3TV69_PASNO